MNIPNIFEAGKKVIAAAFNANFSAIETAINQNATDIETINSEISAMDFINADGSTVITKPLAYKKVAITGATNATPIVITANAHGYATGENVYIENVAGNTAANGSFVITKQTDNTFQLNSSVGNGAYTSGGTSYLLPTDNEDLANKAYVVENTKNAANKTLSNLTLATALTNLGFGAKSLAANGYFTLPGGLIVQWGKTPITTSSLTITFPIAFPTNALTFLTTSYANVVDTGGIDAETAVSNNSLTKTGVVLSSYSAADGVYWIALGY